MYLEYTSLKLELNYFGLCFRIRLEAICVAIGANNFGFSKSQHAPD